MQLEIHNMAGHLIRRMNQISTSVFQTRMKEHGIDLTQVQFAALNAIRAYPETDQATLAGLIAYDRATIGGVVDRLEAKGLIERKVRPEDRRARQLTITEQGQKVLAEMSPLVRDLQAQILNGLSASERETFLQLAEKAATAGNQYSRAPLVTPE